MYQRRALWTALAGALLTLGACANDQASPPDPAGAEGRFVGRWSSDGALPPLTLALTQAAAVVRGQAFLSGVTFPVEGSVRGDSLVLRSTTEPVHEIRAALGADGVLRARLGEEERVLRKER